MPVAACGAEEFATDVAQPFLKLAAIPRRVLFSDGSGGQDEFVAERGRDRASCIEQRLEVRFGGLLKSQDRFATITPVRMAAGEQFALGE
jgi:hypothetical protein